MAKKSSKQRRYVSSSPSAGVKSSVRTPQAIYGGSAPVSVRVVSGRPVQAVSGSLRSPVGGFSGRLAGAELVGRTDSGVLAIPESPDEADRSLRGAQLRPTAADAQSVSPTASPQDISGPGQGDPSLASRFGSALTALRRVSFSDFTRPVPSVVALFGGAIKVGAAVGANLRDPTFGRRVQEQALAEQKRRDDLDLLRARQNAEQQISLEAERRREDAAKTTLLEGFLDPTQKALQNRREELAALTEAKRIRDAANDLIKAPTATAPGVPGSMAEASRALAEKVDSFDPFASLFPGASSQSQSSGITDTLKGLVTPLLIVGGIVLGSQILKKR